MPKRRNMEEEMETKKEEIAKAIEEIRITQLEAHNIILEMGSIIGKAMDESRELLEGYFQLQKKKIGDYHKITELCGIKEKQLEEYTEEIHNEIYEAHKELWEKRAKKGDKMEEKEIKERIREFFDSPHADDAFLKEGIERFVVSMDDLLACDRDLKGELKEISEKKGISMERYVAGLFVDVYG